MVKKEGKREDTFSGFHPTINFVYFTFVLGVSMFFLHPLILGIMLFSAIIYSTYLLGLKKAFRFNFLFMLPMLIIVALINPLFNHAGVTILFYLDNGNPITLESIIYGIVLAVVLVTVIIWFSCYNRVMTSDKFIYLFGRLIPALSLVLSMVLRMVPKFKTQLKVIIRGQQCIGKDPGTGNLIIRVRNGITILSIMITWALENAIETADSMKARGYGLKGRSSFALYRFDKRDGILMGIMIALIILFFIGLGFGHGFAQYNPIIIVQGVAPFSPMSLMTYGVAGIFALIPMAINLYYQYKWKKIYVCLVQEAEIALPGGSVYPKNLEEEWLIDKNC